MSYQFVLGPSGAEKSKYLQETLVRLSIDEPEHKFLYIVPDQYNMQAQKDMILLHPDRAFSNIEVLSFSRLSHRILEEVGGEEIPVLDDTGKSLIIRHVSENVKDELCVMASKLDRIGFVHEVKSALSEFMQYALTPEDVGKLIESAESKPALQYKLKDLLTIYSAFLDYKKNSFITREETLDIACRGLHKSELIKGSTIVFDGFTGFTPIQERLIRELMLYAKKLVISFDLEEGGNPYSTDNSGNLFYLSQKSIARIQKLADEASVGEDEAIFLSYDESIRRSPEITHLENNIFRYPLKRYEDECSNIQIYRALKVRDEITDTCQRIRDLTDKEGLHYRDIAVVIGNLSEYADAFAEIADDFGIPVYMDYNRAVTLSPFIEALRSAFDVIERDFSTDSVMRNLRCGFAGIDRNECDELENFLLRTGIRGHKSYEHTWTVYYNRPDNETDEHKTARLSLMEKLNIQREHILEYLLPLTSLKDNMTVRDYCLAVFKFMSNAHMEARLDEYALRFEGELDRERASEYKQIYAKVIGLLDQMVALTGDEKMTVHEFREILEAGFAELKLGVIPQEADRVIVGDIERTRLNNIRVLFFMGVNDGNIPSGDNAGGLISDLDREYLLSIGAELKPTPKEQMYIQRLYLYMNMSKPLDKLVVTYSTLDMSGKSLRPSYLIDILVKMYPSIEIKDSDCTHRINDRVMPAGKHLVKLDYADKLREYARNGLDEQEETEIAILHEILKLHGMDTLRNELEREAFAHYKSAILAGEIADRLYGKMLKISISRLEKFSSCAYAHFLSYGLQIRERSEFGFEYSDKGEIYHSVLEQFAKKLQAENIAWNEYTEEQSHAWVDEMLDDLSKTYGETILLSTARRQAMTKRLGRILKRTVDTLQYQISEGDFEPTDFEKLFASSRNLEVDGREIKMNIMGKIDRIDLCEKDGKVYVRVVDYKSGNKDFDISALYHGLQLQLAVYMKQAMELEKKTHRGASAEPAGMLYYHISDPIIEVADPDDEEERMKKIKDSLQMKGVVGSETDSSVKMIYEDDIPTMMDHKLAAQVKVKSDIIPVTKKKDGEASSGSKILSTQEMNTVLDYADKKLTELAMSISKGDISAKPCMMEKQLSSPCDYCAYKSVCRRNSGQPGYSELKYTKEDEETILQKMKDYIG